MQKHIVIVKNLCETKGYQSSHMNFLFFGSFFNRPLKKKKVGLGTHLSKSHLLLLLLGSKMPTK